MLCIIASHANVWNYFSDNIIGAWSVFVFFFISALFIKQDSKKALNYSRFLKLFIPYLLWCLIGALIYFYNVWFLVFIIFRIIFLSSSYCCQRCMIIAWRCIKTRAKIQIGFTIFQIDSMINYIYC